MEIFIVQICSVTALRVRQLCTGTVMCTHMWPFLHFVWFQYMPTDWIGRRIYPKWPIWCKSNYRSENQVVRLRNRLNSLYLQRLAALYLMLVGPKQRTFTYWKLLYSCKSQHFCKTEMRLYILLKIGGNDIHCSSRNVIVYASFPVNSFWYGESWEILSTECNKFVHLTFKL